MPYHAQRSMSPVIPRSDYGSPEAFARDVRVLRDNSWQLVGTFAEVAEPGDYLACETLGIPILVRNFEGTWAAFLNVCAHRHCLLVDQGCGNAPTLKCRYHGWNYGVDGRTRKLPGAKNFPKFDRETHRLQNFRVEACGELLFVNFRPDGPSLADALKGDFIELCRATNPDQWKRNLATHFDFDADWKIPIEGSLESYHLEEVHAATFGHDPGEEHTTHHLRDHGTEFSTSFRTHSFLERMEERSIRFLTGDFRGQYRHLHLFPNVMASLNDSVSLIYQTTPVAPGKSRMKVWGFGRTATRGGIVGKALAVAMRRASARMAVKVLGEDAGIFPKVQAGMTAIDPDHPSSRGVLGRCEERLHAFQTDWMRRCHTLTSTLKSSPPS